ncbi:MAG: outer membrane lipoprotein-sorting protein [Cellvibrionales bacterium]|nr:MAG: outer membrane lipoprotein-sorting protein [Cellvibrionales bacterium]
MFKNNEIKKIGKVQGLVAAGAFALFAASPLAFAKSTPEEIAKLGLEGTELTPAGATRAGNAEGTIPEWKNETIQAPSDFVVGQFHTDPFRDDKVLFKITAQNYNDYADKLSDGQKAMFKTYPDWFMNVYETRRTAVYAPYIYKAAIENAATAEIVHAPDSGKGIVGFKNAHHSWAFPIPKDGNELLMNQASRPLNTWVDSMEQTLAITSTGKYTVNQLSIQQHYKYSDPDITDFDPETDHMLYYQTLLAPAKVSGQVVLARDPTSFTKKFRSAWVYSPGQRRVKRAPQIVYDNPLTASDGLATTDQKWGFNGPNDRFSWKMLGKKEMYVPYNAYKLHATDAGPENIITPEGRLNMDYARYELHRVWVLEGTLKEGTTHDYAKRTMFLDEDSYFIMVVDGYDRRGDIWRYWEDHDVMYYDIGMMAPAAEFQYDMQAGRMLALLYDKETPPDFTGRWEDKYFTPASVRRNGVR